MRNRIPLSNNKKINVLKEEEISTNVKDYASANYNFSIPHIICAEYIIKYSAKNESKEFSKSDIRDEEFVTTDQLESTFSELIQNNFIRRNHNKVSLFVITDQYKSIFERYKYSFVAYIDDKQKEERIKRQKEKINLKKSS